MTFQKKHHPRRVSHETLLSLAAVSVSLVLAVWAMRITDRSLTASVVIPPMSDTCKAWVRFDLGQPIAVDIGSTMQFDSGDWTTVYWSSACGSVTRTVNGKGVSGFETDNVTFQSVTPSAIETGASTTSFKRYQYQSPLPPGTTVRIQSTGGLNLSFTPNQVACKVYSGPAGGTLLPIPTSSTSIIPSEFREPNAWSVRLVDCPKLESASMNANLIRTFDLTQPLPQTVSALTFVGSLSLTLSASADVAYNEQLFTFQSPADQRDFTTVSLSGGTENVISGARDQSFILDFGLGVPPSGPTGPCTALVTDVPATSAAPKPIDGLTTEERSLELGKRKRIQLVNCSEYQILVNDQFAMLGTSEAALTSMTKGGIRISAAGSYVSIEPTSLAGEGTTVSIRSTQPDGSVDQTFSYAASDPFVANASSASSDLSDGSDLGNCPCPPMANGGLFAQVLRFVGLSRPIASTDCPCDGIDPPVSTQQCGNSIIEGDEMCDGGNIGAFDCFYYGPQFNAGSPACDLNCMLTIGSCVALGGPGCNNDGIRQDGEQCDGTDFAGNDCGYAGPGYVGQLTCDENCQIQTVACAPPPDSNCNNNNVKEGVEQCDGNDFGGESCSYFSASYDTGSLFCNNCVIEIGTCATSAPPGCNLNGIKEIENDEVCDGSDFGGIGCSYFGSQFDQGEPFCDDSCQIQLGSCSQSPPPACANEGEMCDGWGGATWLPSCCVGGLTCGFNGEVYVCQSPATVGSSSSSSSSSGGTYNLSLVHTADVSQPSPGSTLAYTIRVSNTGLFPALSFFAGPTLTDVLPAGVTFVSATPSPSSVNGQTITWDLSPVWPLVDQQITVTATVDSNAATTAPLTATASLPGALSAGASVTVTTVAACGNTTIETFAYDCVHTSDCNQPGAPGGVCVAGACTEQCDDGNTVDGDLCNSRCQTIACGNGHVDSFNLIDPGSTCPSPSMIVAGFPPTGYCIEGCDDGNTVSGDGCSATCGQEFVVSLSSVSSVSSLPSVGSSSSVPACVVAGQYCATDAECCGGGSCAYDPTLGDTACGVCGDGIITGGEQCDGLNFGAATCTTSGYDNGQLTCAPGCVISVATCNKLPVVVKSHTALPMAPRPGQSIVYTLVVENTSAFTATSVNVIDDLPSALQNLMSAGGVGQFIGGDFVVVLPTLGPGSTATFTLTGTVPANANAGDSYAAAASVNGALPTTVSPVAVEPGKGCVLVQVTGIAAWDGNSAIAALPGFAFQLGTDPTNTITTDINGRAVFGNVVPGVVNITHLPSMPSRWRRPSGAVDTKPVIVAELPPGSVGNTGCAVVNFTDEEYQSPVQPTKTASVSKLLPDQTMDYTVVLQNVDLVRSVSVNLQDSIPAQLQYQSLQQGGNNVPAIQNGSTLTWSATVPANQSVTFTIGVRAKDAATLGLALSNAVNTVSVLGGPSDSCTVQVDATVPLPSSSSVSSIAPPVSSAPVPVSSAGASQSSAGVASAGSSAVSSVGASFTSASSAATSAPLALSSSSATSVTGVSSSAPIAAVSSSSVSTAASTSSTLAVVSSSSSSVPATGASSSLMVAIASSVSSSAPIAAVSSSSVPTAASTSSMLAVVSSSSSSVPTAGGSSSSLATVPSSSSSFASVGGGVSSVPASGSSSSSSVIPVSSISSSSVSSGYGSVSSPSITSSSVPGTTTNTKYTCDTCLQIASGDCAGLSNGKCRPNPILTPIAPWMCVPNESVCTGSSSSFFSLFAASSSVMSSVASSEQSGPVCWCSCEYVQCENCTEELTELCGLACESDNVYACVQSSSSVQYVAASSPSSASVGQSSSFVSSSLSSLHGAANSPSSLSSSSSSSVQSSGSSSVSSADASSSLSSITSASSESSLSSVRSSSSSSFRSSASSSVLQRPNLWCDRGLQRNTTVTYLPDYDPGNPQQDLAKGGMIFFRVPREEENPSIISLFFKRGSGNDPRFEDAETPAIRDLQNANARDALQSCLLAKDTSLCLQGAQGNRRCVIMSIDACVVANFSVFGLDDRAACCATADVACGPSNPQGAQP